MKDKTEESDDKNTSKGMKLLSFIEEELDELFLDQNGEAFVSFTNERGCLESYKVSGAEFAAYLQDLAYQKMKAPIKIEALNEVLQILTIKAKRTNDRRKLYRRVGKSEGALYYDLGEDKLKVDQEGWSIERIKKQVFRFNKELSLCQETPVKNGNAWLLFNSVNVPSEDDRLLILLFLVVGLIPDVPHPILIVHGPKGSGKSGLAKKVLQILDPTPAVDVNTSREEDFLLLAAQRWVISMDNVSNISAKQSDLICKLVTESAFTKRSLYTNDTMKVMQLRNVIIMNGIPCVAQKEDLLERSILIEMTNINSESRKTEGEINEEFQQNLPRILGGLFDVLAKSLNVYPDLKLKEMTRMADFHRYAVAAGLALGVSQDHVEAVLHKNRTMQFEASSESSWFVQMVVDYLTERFTYSGTASGVLKELRDFVEENGLPYARQINGMRPNGLTRQLKRLSSTLEHNGIKFEKDPRGASRTFVLEMDEKVREERRAASFEPLETDTLYSSFERTKVRV